MNLGREFLGTNNVLPGESLCFIILLFTCILLLLKTVLIHFAGVADMIEEIQVEGTSSFCPQPPSNSFFLLFHSVSRIQTHPTRTGTFQDGTKLVTVHNPIANEDGNFDLALDPHSLSYPHFYLIFIYGQKYMGVFSPIQT